MVTALTSFYITAKIHLFKEVGRKTPITADRFKCPMIIRDEAFDCCLFLQETLGLGQTSEKIRIEFLSPDLVRSLIKPGDLFHLWESRVFAYGIVESCEEAG